MSDVNILLNGKPESCISAMDRGLHYGDGLFETISVVAGEIPFWQYHVKRLARSCQRMMLPMPDEVQLLNEIKQLITDNRDVIVKLILTRGEAERGYHLPANPQPSRLVYAFEKVNSPTDYWESGINARICHTRLATQPALAGIKHLNRLEQILARSEWHNSDIQEGIMCDICGNVIEATSHNIFMVKSGEILTPSLSECGVEGIMRDFVLDLARQEKIPFKITTIPLDQLDAMDEVFLTNSIHGIWPITKIGEKMYPLGELTGYIRDKVASLLPCK